MVVLAVAGLCGSTAAAFTRIIVEQRSYRQFILGPHVAALDPQLSAAVDADERPGDGEVFGSVNRRTVVIGFERGLDFVEPRVDLFGKICVTGVGGFDLGVFGDERLACRFLVGGQLVAFADQPAQDLGMAVGEVGSRLDPAPASS